MEFIKYFKSLFVISPHKKEERHHKRKAAIFWQRFLRILTMKVLVVLVLILFLTFFGISFAEAPIHALVDQFNKPKPIFQSSTVLSSDVQSAIQDIASNKLKQEQ